MAKFKVQIIKDIKYASLLNFLKLIFDQKFLNLRGKFLGIFAVCFLM